MNQLFDEDGMLIIRDPSLLIPLKRRSENDTWSKKMGNTRVCKSCGSGASGKPLETCTSPKHRRYYENGLRRHRRSLEENLECQKK